MKEFFQKRFHALKTGNHWMRKSVGVLLVAGGIVGFLPILGYWMLPLGLALLAVDFPMARRLQRRLLVRWERIRRRLGGDKPRTRRTPGNGKHRGAPRG